MSEYEKSLLEIKKSIKKINDLSFDDQVYFINDIRKIVSDVSPFKSEPVDFVQWIKCDNVIANDYNPNSVAPPEMELLRLSIFNDGYTQPIVAWGDDEKKEVIDGFHRNRVGKECKDIQKRIHGFLPIVTINSERSNKKNRIASTIRHNRARGKHKVESMSDIVLELKNRNWTNKRICKELGMDEDEILRLCQITGLDSLFQDEEFSKSWDIGDSSVESEFETLTDEVDVEEREKYNFRTVNTGDSNRIFHTHDKWECYKAGFYDTNVKNKTKEECELEFSEFLSDLDKFESALAYIITNWVYSCEHYLTNTSMNRVAWLGQACVCYKTGIPSKYSPGWFLLSKEKQEKANRLAVKYLNKWLIDNGMEEISFKEAMTSKQNDIY